MTIETRFDGSGLGKARKDARGFLVVPARPARTGILTYRRADGSTVRELRRDEDVFAPESLETYAGASVTVGHVVENVTPANVRALEVGVVASAGRRDGAFVAADVCIRDKATIERVESGELVELSAGYSVSMDHTPGEFEGQRYDAVQRVIRINHLALLPKGGGRSGSDVRLRLDAHSAYLDEEDASSATQREDDAGNAPAAEATRMATVMVRLDGRDVEFSAEGAAAVAKLQSDLDKTTARADAAEAKVTKATADLAAATDPQVRADSVKARVQLEKTAAKVLGDDDLAALSDRDVRVKAISKASPEFKCDGKSDDYVAAAFDTLVASAKVRNDGLEVVSAIVGAAKVGTPAESGLTLEQARAKRNDAANAAGSK